LIFLILPSFYACGTLYGLTKVDIHLERIDPATYELTPIGKGVVGQTSEQGLTAIDSLNGIFYFLTYNQANQTTNLIGLSVENGAEIFHVELPLTKVFLFFGFNFFLNVEPKTGDIFVIAPLSNNTLSDSTILRVNRRTRVVQIVATIERGKISTTGFSAYDATNNIIFAEYYPIGSNNEVLRGYDASTGKVVRDIDPSPFITIDWDPKTGLLYGIGVGNYIFSLNGKTGEITKIAPIDYEYSGLLSDERALDPASRSLFFFGFKLAQGVELVSINIDTGKVVSAVPAFTNSLDSPYGIEYRV